VQFSLQVPPSVFLSMAKRNELRLCILYSVLKDFAGPVATIIAAAVATFITWRLGSRQVAIAASQANTADAQRAIAQSQRDIAYDRLKYDLFRMRYDVYQAAKEAIERVIRTGTERPVSDMELLNLRLKMDEARFFFAPQVLQLFENIDDLITQHEVSRASWSRFNDDDAVRFREGGIMADAITRLSDIHRHLAEALTSELGFGLLISPPSPAARGIQR
jgi:hypothetical protein